MQQSWIQHGRLRWTGNKSATKLTVQLCWTLPICWRFNEVDRVEFNFVAIVYQLSGVPRGPRDASTSEIPIFFGLHVQAVSINVYFFMQFKFTRDVFVLAQSMRSEAIMSRCPDVPDRHNSSARRAERVSLLHTCCGGGIIWPRPVLRSLQLLRQGGGYAITSVRLSVCHTVCLCAGLVCCKSIISRFHWNLVLRLDRFSLTILVSIHLLIHFSTHLWHHPHFRHPSLFHSRLKTYLFNKSFSP